MASSFSNFTPNGGHIFLAMPFDRVRLALRGCCTLFVPRIRWDDILTKRCLKLKVSLYKFANELAMCCVANEYSTSSGYKEHVPSRDKPETEKNLNLVLLLRGRGPTASAAGFISQMGIIHTYCIMLICIIIIVYKGM